MPPLHGLDAGDARADQLPAAGVAGHQVRLDQPRGDLQLGAHVPSVDPGGDPPRGRPDQGMLLHPRAVVVLHAIGSGDLVAEHLPLLGRGAGPVQSGRDQDQDLLAGEPRLVKNPEHGTEDGAIGHGPGDVADQDAGILPAPGNLQEAGVPIGDSRGRRHRPLGIIQGGDVANRQRADHAVRGELDRQSGPAIVKGDVQ